MFCAIVGPPGAAIEPLARLCSPRVEVHAEYGAHAAVFDASGLSRVLGTPRQIGEEVIRLAAERGLAVKVALASSSTAAWLLAHHARGPVTVIEAGRDAAALATLPIAALLTVTDLVMLAEDTRFRRVPRGRAFRAAPAPLRQSNAAMTQRQTQVLATLERWGVTRLGQVAALPRAEMHARFGALGVRMHEAAMGRDRQPMQPGEAPRRFVERLALEWPIEGLEPLSFVLGRLCDTLSKQLEAADRGAVSVTTRLALVSKTGHERTLQLPAPMRDPRVLRTLIVLDLEAHPVTAGIDVVEVAMEVSPGRIVQGALFVRTLPTAESLATLVARLGALMGERRVGAPKRLDTHDERDTELQDFEVRQVRPVVEGAVRTMRRAVPELMLRRVRPVRALKIAPGDVVAKAGPWRSSGRWWRKDASSWDRETWDVALKDGTLVRVSRTRGTRSWELEGTYD